MHKDNPENKIKVSILVITYNQEKFIRETLNGILLQKHNYSYEIIVCDDASYDSTPSIVLEYSIKYPEIIGVLRKKNLGLIKNFYDGVHRSKGEYLMVCAGDDYWLPDKIEKQIEFMDSDPSIGICYGDAKKINENGDSIGSLIGTDNTSFERLIKSNCVPACTICIRRSLLEEYIEEVNPISRNWKMEDYPLLLWFAANSKVSYLKGECAVYRALDNSACHYDNSQYKKWLEYSKNRYDIKMYYADKYSGRYKNIRYKISNNYIVELLIRRTIHNEELKLEVNRIIKAIPYANYFLKKTILFVNNNNTLNKGLARLYRLLRKLDQCPRKTEM